MAVSADIDLGEARARLVELDLERAALRERIAVLERDAGGPDITSAVGRVALFASLFRGREDVFATRWESTRTPGNSGWAPSAPMNGRLGRPPTWKCSTEILAGYSIY
ncbi:MAG: TOTE conflict system archaeo-eukaryotic primase domain-containing protein [Solirubrobacteraceae bacterium]